MKRFATYLMVAALAVSLGVAGCSKKDAGTGKGEAGKAAPAAAEKAEKAAPAPVKSEASKYADDLCAAAKKGFVEFGAMMSHEFMVRMMYTEEQIKGMGQTYEQLAAASEKAMAEGAKTQTDNEGLETCDVLEVKDMSCEDLFKEMETKGTAASMPMKADVLKKAGENMTISECAWITLDGKTKGKGNEKVDVASGKTKTGWKVLMFFQPTAAAQ